jgi:hypothetical protein
MRRVTGASAGRGVLPLLVAFQPALGGGFGRVQALMFLAFGLRSRTGVTDRLLRGVPGRRAVGLARG